MTFLALRTVVGAMADQNTFVTEATDAAEIYVDPRFGYVRSRHRDRDPARRRPDRHLPTGTAPAGTTGTAPADTAPAG